MGKVIQALIGVGVHQIETSVKEKKFIALDNESSSEMKVKDLRCNVTKGNKIKQ